jgi:hypothetical protein
MLVRLRCYFGFGQVYGTRLKISHVLAFGQVYDTHFKDFTRSTIKIFTCSYIWPISCTRHTTNISIRSYILTNLLYLP